MEHPKSMYKHTQLFDVMKNIVLEFVEEEEFAKRKRSRDDEDTSSKQRLKYRREEENDTVLVEHHRFKDPSHDIVFGEAPRLEENSKQLIRQCFGDDEDDSPSCSETVAHRISKFRRKEEDECANDTVLVEPSLLESSEQSVQQRFGDSENLSPSSSEMVTHREGDDCENDAVFYKSWRDSLSDDKDPSSSSPSEDEVAALILLQLSTQTQTQKEPQMQTQTSLKFACSVCGKGFSSYQALGGHKASHRVKNAIADAGDKTRQKMMAPSGKIHKCSICHSVFPTGQSLGGHKRRHYEGVLGSQKRSHNEIVLGGGGDKSWSPSDGSVVTNVSDPEQIQSLLELQCIDLNKPPLPEFYDNGDRNVEEVESEVIAN